MQAILFNKCGFAKKDCMIWLRDNGKKYLRIIENNDYYRFILEEEKDGFEYKSYYLSGHIVIIQKVFDTSSLIEKKNKYKCISHCVIT